MSLLEQNYPGEIEHVEWHAIQGFASSDSWERVLYYVPDGKIFAPSTYFDGGDVVVGGGENLYPIYEPIFSAHRAALSQVAVGATVSFDEDTRSGSIDVTVQVAPGETIPDVSTTRIRCAIYEDDIDLGGETWNHIGRAIVLDVPLTVSMSGEIQSESGAFDLEDPNPPGGAFPWGPAANFRAIAFVQRDDSRAILNAARAAITSPTDAPVVPRPLLVALRQNAPNPFAVVTRIGFDLARSAEVRLAVFDVSGRRVVGLFDGRLPAGSHSVRWDGTDARGARVASGVYLYRLETGDRSVTREMTFLR